MHQMKKIILSSFVLIFISFIATAQRYAIIDTKYILGKIPDYLEAQVKLTEFSERWQNEIDQKQKDLNKLQKDFEAEQVILPENLRKKREEEIARRQTILQDLQRTRFGFEGDLFKKRAELIKPIQDLVYNAIQKLAIEKQYDFILDKSEGITVIFADPKLDKSEEILKTLGIK
jgi:outer membrane protein